MNHLSKIYAGNKVVVDDFNLNVKKGEFICLIGTSGSGKTTTMRMINRMLKPTKGTIKINGENINDIDPVQLRRRIGYVIQNIGLMPHMTIKENITLVPRLLKWSKEKCDARAVEMIKLVDLPEDFLDRYPSELSGGQQQRIGVIRALAADQNIILMDEPFGALDPITREDLQDLVKDLQKRLDKTFIFVTHDMDEALRLSDRIVVMDAGKQIQVANHDEILRHPANDFVANLIGQDRLIQAKPSIMTIGQVAIKPVSIDINEPMIKALEIMNSRRVDTLLVTDENQYLKGSVSVEDINKYYRSGKKINEIMDRNVFYVNENSIIRDTVDRILKRGLRNVPVVDNNKHLTGIVTRVTLVDMVYDALWGGDNDDVENSDNIQADTNSETVKAGEDQ